MSTPRIIDQIENWRAEAEAQAAARIAIESAARAVIAAGRPHVDHPYCVCAKCEAHAALAELLKTP